MRAVATLVSLLVAAGAAADPKADLAAAMRVSPDAILDAQDFRVAAPPYHRAIAGHYKRGEHVAAGVALVWCDRQQRCWFASAHLHGRGDLEVLGLVDLAGPPAAFPTHRIDARYGERTLALPARARWPALVVRLTSREQQTTTSRYSMKRVSGTYRRSELVVLSLARADVRAPAVLRAVVDERWPTGSGQTTTFAVARDGALVATEQRHLENTSTCLRPKPTTTRYVLDRKTRRFKKSELGEHTGCR